MGILDSEYKIEFWWRKSMIWPIWRKNCILEYSQTNIYFWPILNIWDFCHFCAKNPKKLILKDFVNFEFLDKKWAFDTLCLFQVSTQLFSSEEAGASKTGRIRNPDESWNCSRNSKITKNVNCVMSNSIRQLPKNIWKWAMPVNCSNFAGNTWPASKKWWKNWGTKMVVNSSWISWKNYEIVIWWRIRKPITD